MYTHFKRCYLCKCVYVFGTLCMYIYKYRHTYNTHTHTHIYIYIYICDFVFHQYDTLLSVTSLLPLRVMSWWSEFRIQTSVPLILIPDCRGFVHFSRNKLCACS